MSPLTCIKELLSYYSYVTNVFLTGTIDLDLITNGVSVSERMRRDNSCALTTNPWKFEASFESVSLVVKFWRPWV